MSAAQLVFDSQHIWHPYTNLLNPTPVFAVESADGVYLNLSSGERVIDGMASWWSAIHGYNHPVLNQAVKSQLDKMSHVMFGGLTHQPAIELCEKLIEITDSNLQCVFLADSGSVSVEVALKMAIQYWYSKIGYSKKGYSKNEQSKSGPSKGDKQKSKFLSFKNAYHGDTFGAMSVSDPENGMHSMFAGVLPQHFFVSAPTCLSDDDWKSEYINEFKAILNVNHNEIAAVIIEPLVQGAGGMRFYCSEYLRQIRKLCDEFNVLLIFDEIATGFARTGSFFAYEEAKVVPDILCLGKALTGGYMSLAATLTSRKVADTISAYQGGNLMHGPTFMANPLACSVAIASLNLLLNSDWKSKIADIEKQLIEELRQCKNFENVVDVRVKGAIGVIELKEPVDMERVQIRFIELGVWLRPFGKLIYIMPPYIIKPSELTQLTTAMVQVSKESF
ncbi:MAG: adenosylmethionine--8-amino-7-oxononanoate transaminase [Gammaproteobacteria bacterium]|nr:MAG: adenosylmethionine--8-amino-7-oxononanoate transaminase [Gammaproteobacteria bacterium]